ncbi:uncharacterized protein LOC127083625 [Lathyrus oleraceus]|uniref:Uncharacterized protein n=1 Tax=Pisum sativum TaxID=3888 RepID=A0A9D5BRI5_PEA|nr:uncharacterized protein LOC127083625 [Pisum sativum]KAI5448271.1 hypothetical protein KIW84_015627 [Pisum sativum]
MDLETENRLAAMLMREAAELRRQSEKDGVLAYLQKPNVRSRPNSRFLTATVRGVQQANRAVEVNEMWRAREKELELDKRASGTSSRDKSSDDKGYRNYSSSRNAERHDGADKSTGASASCSTKKEREHTPEGLKDEELEEFLHSRKKRGRGAIGPRMDETGPYLPANPDGEPSTSPDLREYRVIYGPQRPTSLRSYESSDDEVLEEKRKKSKKSHKSHSDKGHSKKHRSKEKSKHKKKKTEEKRSKHRR